MKILIVEDEPLLRETMQLFLEKERYVVETAGTVREGLSKALTYNYDCILLDIMLPDGSGLTFLQELKKSGKPDNIIIISAKDSVDDKVTGLELGADDYLAKPFHLSELNARIKSLIRRKNSQGAFFMEMGNTKVVPDKFEVLVNDIPLELNRKEYDILHYFISRSGTLIDKTTLAEAVWGDHIDQVDNFDFVYAQIKNLRKKMNDADANIEIKAIYGFGYRLVMKQQA